MSNNRITITGARGLLGSNLASIAADHGYVVTALGREELDLADPEALSSWRPDADWVVNCAAVTDVDACEDGDGVLESLAVNAVAPEILAGACRRGGVGFIHVGTDYVFYGDGMGGGNDGWYDETDEALPKNRYGTHKLMGEKGALHHGAYVLRTAWVYGCGGKNFISKAYEFGVRKKNLTVDDVSSTTPTLAVNLARYVLAVAEADERASGELYHCCDLGEATRWEVFDRVRKHLGLSSDEWRVAKGQAFDSGRAKRPNRTPLDSSAFFLRFRKAEQQTVKQAVAGFVTQCRGVQHVVAGEVVG